MTLKTRTCRPDGSSYSQRIDQSTWNIYRWKLEELHNARMPRAAMLDILHHEFGFSPSLAQLNAQMIKWRYTVHTSKNGPKTTDPDLIYDAEVMATEDCVVHSAEDELCGSPILPPTMSEMESRTDDFSPASVLDHYGSPYSPSRGTPDSDALESQETQSSGSPRMTNTKVTNPLLHAKYCSQACCEKLMQYHRHMIAANFLTCLQCRSSASSILLSLIEEMAAEPSVPSPDHVWAKLNYNRLNGGVFAPDRRTSIWSTPDWRSVPSALRDYIVSADSTKPTSPLSHMSLMSQYRRTGSFQYHPPYAKVSVNNDLETEVLRKEITKWESDTRLLARIALWCIPKLKMACLRKELKQISVHLRDLKERAKLHVLTFPRIVACHLLAQWMEEPCPDLLKSLMMLRGVFGCFASLEVMLPETFIALTLMMIEQADFSHFTPEMFAQDAFTDRFIFKLYSSLEAMCALPLEEYCARFAEKLLSTYSQTSFKSNGDECKYSDQLVLRLAYRIMGKGFVNKYGFEKAANEPSFTWMPMADCFKVHEVSSQPYLFTRTESVQPCDLDSAADKARQQFESDTVNLGADSNPVNGGSSAKRAPSSHGSEAACEPPNGPVEHQQGDDTLPRATTALQRTLAVRVKRMDTNSSGRMSIDSMRELQSRTQAKQLIRDAGVARYSSNSSRITLGSQFSFGLVTGLGRVNSTASKFSFEAESMSIEAVSPGIEDRLGQVHNDPIDIEAQAEMHRKVSEWITREFSQKKRPEFGRRSTEPIFVFDGKRASAEMMLIEVQECV